jgi:hypothetical protein
VQTEEETCRQRRRRARLPRERRSQSRRSVLSQGFATAGTRQWEMIREIIILDELMGDPGVAQIAGVIAAGDHDTTRPLAILIERCPTNLDDLIACVPLPNLYYLLVPLGSAPSACSQILACHKSSTHGQPKCELLFKAIFKSSELIGLMLVLPQENQVQLTAALDWPRFCTPTSHQAGQIAS